MHLLGIDDAALTSQLLYNQGLSAMDNIFCNVRKGTIHVVLSTQVPETLSPGIVANCANKIVFRLDSGAGIEAMQRHMGITEAAQREYFYKLNQKEHEVIVEFARRSRPFVAKILNVNVPRRMGEQELHENNKRLLRSFSPVVPRVQEGNAATETTQQNNGLLTADEKDFLDLAFHCFDSPLTALYHRREWGIQKGDEVVNALEKKGYVVKVRLNPSGKRGGLSVFLFHTEKYYSLTGREKPIPGTDGKGPDHQVQLRMTVKNVKDVKQCQSVSIGKAFLGARCDAYFEHEGFAYIVEVCSSTVMTEAEKLSKILGNSEVKAAFVIAKDKELVKKIQSELDGHKLRDRIIVCQLSQFLNRGIKELLQQNKEEKDGTDDSA